MKTFFIIAGEPSGDKLGAALMAGLKSEIQVKFLGVGGPLMAAEGLESLFPMDELSVMGIAEVLPKLRGLLRRNRETADAVLASDADALITIDSPDFCLRVAEKVKAARPDFPVIHYVAPSVWAWRPKRAVKMAKHVDHVLALLPFEPPYMEVAGMTCDFVGHPVVAEETASNTDIAKFRKAIGVEDGQKLLTLLPGSRSGEVARLSPIFRKVVEKLRSDLPDLSIVIPSVGPRVDDLKDAFDGLDAHILDPREMSADDAETRKRICFAASDAALAASGTVSLELAAAGTPMVVAYQMNPISSYLMKRAALIDTVTLINLITDTRKIPELLLENCTPDKIYPEILDLLVDPTKKKTQQDVETRTMELLGKGGEPPGLRAARSVLKHI